MKPGRNDVCPRGSGRKYKKCCEAKDAQSRGGRAPGLVFAQALQEHQQGRLEEAERLIGVRIHAWDDMDLKNDQEGLAASIPALDLVLSAITAVAQMAGAVGAPAWVLSRLADQGCWGLGTGHCPWHPSPRAFSRGATDGWEPVLESVASELRLLVSAGSAPVEALLQ
ncbi:MAG: SEC-C metal-binding domain-containing protein [Bryobacterales bacterium]|nr:SEC-C metal-binding domain-containing protein [Bryobacterales bacterium]